jgi:hypothetical protein
MKIAKVENLVAQAARDGAGLEQIREAWQEARAYDVSEEKVRAAVASGWAQAVAEALDDGVLDEMKEHRLAVVAKQLGFEQDELDVNGAFSQLVKAGVLRDLLNGKVPTRVTIVDGPLPFNFQKTEHLVWVFLGVEYLEDKVRREYVGSSQGFSFRIAKGVYYRVGAFRGRPVERTHRERVDRGIMAVTTKHIYFASAAKSFRIRHDKIVTHIPFSNGVAVVRDAATAKPQVFITGDGWFTVNLLTNVRNI